jgi:hypothetical protein
MSPEEAPEPRPAAGDAGRPAPTDVPRPLDHAPRLSLPEAEEAQAVGYQAVSGLAVLGLLFGLLSPLALLAPAFWLAPLVGIALGLMALARIAQEAPALIGRKAALAGLLLSVVFAAAAPTQWFTYRWLVRREAGVFAMAWFDMLRQREPHKAHQLTDYPTSRRPLDDSLWDYYTNDWPLCQEIRGYVEQPLVRTLLALGNRAEARLYQTENQAIGGDGDLVRQVYAVTYQEQGAKKTFFVRMDLERVGIRQQRQSAWRVQHAEGGIRPVALGGQPGRF